MIGIGRRQAGQAATEAVIVLALLSMLLAGSAYVGSGLAYLTHTQQQSREAAFRAARGEANVSASFDAMAPQRTSAALERQAMGWLQPGGHGAAARTLRREWQLADTGILRAAVAQSRTALLTDAGHTADDAATQHRVAQSSAAWGRVYDRSSSLARTVGARMARTDAGWKRASSTVDWLQRWPDIVPTDVKSRTAPVYRSETRGAIR
ncbi:hypothetical protein [Schauerella aestuarii]|uniref:hypothetical protein n=1 Tax=Schauerella aestuarii TaxID=2511204 RepID=UPI0013693152|nr:hypothetical protein [Achromobacter aestuarii]MYZ46087.1 hypothetical protein [Achromobacter aestuarii]